jgi:hypothetical protein
MLVGPSGLIVSQPPGGAATVKEFFTPGTDYNANMGAFRERNFSGTTQFNFSFIVPDAFLALTSLRILGIPNVTNAAADIDLISDYGAEGEAFNNHSESELGNTYNLVANQLFSIDISPVYSVLAAGDRCGLTVDHNNLGGAVGYIGIHMLYT